MSEQGGIIYGEMTYKREGNMFKNIVIFILFVSTCVFAWLAIRNAQPLPCYEIKDDPQTGITNCIIQIGGDAR